MNSDGDRRKKLLNSDEMSTHKILSAAAENNGARIFPKIRIADTLEINNSGLDNTLYSYALKAHFDFVVADRDNVPLFAVEFDGPYHEQGGKVWANDRNKNQICEKFRFPLARVCDEHIFRQARGVDYLSWLTELFFSSQALAEAQESGIIPEDEPLDPMMFLSNPNISGTFPLFISLEARQILSQLHRRGVLAASGPLFFTGDEANGRTRCLMVIPTGGRTLLMATTSIHLRYFGITPSEAAQEIATVNLAQLAADYQHGKAGSTSPDTIRTVLVKFLSDHDLLSFGGANCDIGFPFSFHHEGGRSWWHVGPLGDAPEVIIHKT